MWLLGFGCSMGHPSHLVDERGQACVIVLFTTACVSRISILNGPMTLLEAMENTESLITGAADTVARFIKLGCIVKT